ncbi:uncharacterized protein LOC110725509 [Chenopodium quinoa]|uniref:uncharacterized protein LOC110725509 n=1 Tax=Chenopodium quinoa TaxID=63459 RepID=UPI000B77CCE9|nr:uncharacterized protein LOC110725509 [Chenopodium quinoa]
MGFIQSKNEYSLFIQRRNSLICVVVVYVEDIILTRTDIDAMQELKAALHILLSIKDLGKLSYFLGIEVGYSDAGILLSQKKFKRELIHDCNIPLKNRAVTPLPLGLKLQQEPGEPLLDAEVYRSHVGKLNFLIYTSRPDLSFVVQSLSQFMHHPYTSHLQALIHTLSYVAQTEVQGILLSALPKLYLHAFSDSD